MNNKMWSVSIIIWVMVMVVVISVLVIIPAQKSKGVIGKVTEEHIIEIGTNFVRTNMGAHIYFMRELDSTLVIGDTVEVVTYNTGNNKIIWKKGFGR